MDILQALIDNTTIRPIDMQAGRFVQRLEKAEEDSLIPLAAAFTSRAVGEGHVCLPLDALAEIINQVIKATITADSLYRKLLKAATVGVPGENTPLILTKTKKLYLHRYYGFEKTIAQAILSRCGQTDNIDGQRGNTILTQLFGPQQAKQDIDRQHMAAAMALVKPLLVISGGPGTGKTYTVARIIAALGAFFPPPFRVCLAAPTGKAAARLKESLQTAKTNLPEQFAATIPDEASTLHRLLRFHPRTGLFHHNRSNPLHLDLLIIDEASMIDTVLMAAIIEALPQGCRLILLGDKNQLTSVEAGNLFGDICGDHQPRWSEKLQQNINQLTGQPHSLQTGDAPIEDSLLFLQKSYRFHDASGIGTLARVVNNQDRNALSSCLQAKFDDLTIHNPENTDLPATLKTFSLPHFAPLFKAPSPVAGLIIFERARILCATHKGESGVERTNQLVESILAKENKIPTGKDYYRGRPIMILANDYSLELFNGDTGIIWPDEIGELRAWFMTAEKTLRSFSLARLPEHQTCYAITIHKSQGSEFDKVLMLVPEQDSPLLTRELLYTGITRAKNHLSLLVTAEILQSTSRRRGRRFSGLYEKIRN